MPKLRLPLWKKILSSKLFIFISIIIIFLISYTLIKEIIREKEITLEIESLKKEIESQGSKNLELTKLIEYFQTGSFIESQARQKLGLKKPGEKVVAIPQNEDLWGKEGKPKEKEEKIPNPVKWWQYFFSSRD